MMILVIMMSILALIMSVEIGTEQKIRGGFLIRREDVSSDKPLRLRRRSLPNDETIYEQRYFYGRGVHVEINGEVKHFPKVRLKMNYNIILIPDFITHI